MTSNGKGAAKGKGKAVASKGSSGKRKRDDEKTGGRKRTNPAVLQFFEDSAAEASDYDTSDFEEDFPDDDDEELKKPSEPHKSQKAPVKEEELSGDELERVLEERYKSGSGYVRYAEDDYETKRVDKNFDVPSAPEPVIWKVKCKIGRERQTIFCLMQKFADLKALGTKLQIVSAFSVEHVRGFIFVEANKQFEVMEACKQLPDVYYSMITHVPSNEFSQMLAVRKKKTEVSKGMWVRVKSGNYKGDLAQVVAVGDSRKKATLKLIPRVDFQALAAKFGAGSSIKRTAVPKPRLIASSDLEEFRPLIQSRRDRDTGMHFEVLDGLMLKDGYLFKKVSIDSLRICDVNPSIEELQKFRTSTNEDSGNVEFLSQIYGDNKDKPTLKPVQVGGKGAGTSGSKEQEDIEMHDLVLFGKREFGMVIGMEKDESYKILKYGLEGSAVVSLAKKDLKNLNLEKKFNALDHRMKTIFANDVVKILDGPLKDKEGVVKQIYRGIIFLYDQNDMEDNAYFCAKSQSCEKVKYNDDICLGKDGEAGPSGCEDLPSSPKTPLSPEKPWHTEEQSRNFNRREQQDGEFSVGQSLRIRVGPLKGYLCRVLAVRRSDVTVKLDSRQKVLTVKSEHLSEVRGKSFATSTCDDTGLDSSRPFDFLGNNAGGNDWMAGSVQNNDKNEEGQSNMGSSWPAFTSSAPSLPWGASSGDTSAPTEDDPWQKKPSTTHEGGSSWGQEVKTDIPSVPQNDTGSSWEKGKNVIGGTSSWGNLDEGSSWGQEVKTVIPSIPQRDASSSWDKGKTVIGGTSSWGNLSSEKDNEKGSDDSAKQWASEPSDCAGWGQQKSSENTGPASQNAWNQSKNSQDKGNNPTQDSWGKAAGETWGSECDPSGTKDWTNPAPASDSQNGGWGAGGSSSQADGNNWGKPKSSIGGASWSKSDLKQQDDSAQNEGWTVGGGFGERSSGTAAWDNGNSGSSGWGQQKSWGKSSETGPNTEGASEGKWGNFKVGDASDRQQDNWKKPNPSGAEGGAPSWGNSSGNDAWGQSSRSDNDQGFSGGRGFGGRRGRGNGGRFDQSGRGRGRSFGRGQFSSWNKEGQDEPSSDRGTGYGDSGSSDKGWCSGKGSWGNHNQGGSSGEGKTWNNDQGWDAGKGARDQDTPSGWKQGGSSLNTSFERSSEPAAGWNSGSSGWGQQKPSEGTADGNSTWGKATEESQGKDAGDWGSAVDSWAKKSGSSEAKEWKSSSDSSGVKSGGWGDSSGKWATQMEDNVSSWNASTRNDSWGQSNSYGNNQGRGGGRGDYGGRGDFGGRRGRGGFRGGRDQPGRGRGGRSFGGRQSWNNEGEDKPSWGGSSGGGNYNQGGGWGNNSQGGGSGGWAKEKGGGGSWGNDKGGNDGGGWGTSGGTSNQGGNGGGGWAKEKSGGSGWGNNDKGGSGGGGWGTSGRTSNQGGNGGGGWGNNDKGGSGGGGWGTSGGTSNGGGGGGGCAKEKGGGGWGNNDKGGSDGGSGWGASGVTNGEGSNSGGSGWGSSSGGNVSTGGWGGSSAGTKGDEGGGSGWGKTKVADAGSGGWGKPPSGQSGAGGEEKATGGGGSGWGSSSGAKAATAGWGGSEGSAGAGSGGWGNSSSRKSGAGGEEKATGGGGGGWGGANKDQGS